MFLSRQSAHQVKLVVGAHAGQVDDAVGEPEKSAEGADVPDILIIKAETIEALVVGFVDGFGLARNLERKVEHGTLSLGDVCLAIIRRELVGDQRILCANSQNCSVRDDAVLTLVVEQLRIDGCRASQVGQGKAQSAGNGMPF